MNEISSLLRRFGGIFCILKKQDLHELEKSNIEIKIKKETTDMILIFIRRNGAVVVENPL